VSWNFRLHDGKVSRLLGDYRSRILVSSALMISNLVLVLLALHGLAAFFLNQETGPGLSICHYSDRVYDDDMALMLRPKAPTHFGLMTSRYVEMVQAARGNQCTGTAAVGYDGHHYLQTGRSDDPGIMELMPAISRFFGVSIANSYDLFILAVISSGVLVGYAGFWKLFGDRRLRVIGVAVFLCLAFAEAWIADDYIFPVAPLIAGIPWLLHLGITGKNLALTLGATLLAFCSSWCSLIRSGSLAICLTFLLTLFSVRHRSQKPLLPLVLIFIACIPSVLFARSVISRRDTALAKIGESAKTDDSHAFWHTFYIGFGFIPNSEVPDYDDRVAAEKVRSIDPSAVFSSAKYQAILRRELWSLLKRRPMLVIGTLAAKTGILILLASILLCPVRRLIFAEPATFWFDAASLLTIGMSAMNGIVAIPRLSYLLTFLCLILLYSSIKLCRSGWLTHGWES